MKKLLKTRIGGGGEHRSLNQQASGFTHVLGLGKSEILKKKTKAFTLAEVLITLAIIGVVAALTIPTVVAKYQKKMYYTQFMKMYNTLSNALAQSVAENGTPDTWGFRYEEDSDSGEILFNNQVEIYDKYVASYLKGAKKIQKDDSDKFSYYLSYLNGKYKYNTSWYNPLFPSYVLPDGSIIRFNEAGSNGWMSIDFDTNGLKGPNILGRDVFLLFSYIKVDKKWILTHDYNVKYVGSTLTLRTREELFNAFLGNNSIYSCNTNVSTGEICGARLLLEGKMDY